MANKHYKYKTSETEKDEDGKSYRYHTLTKNEFESFNSEILGLGNINEDGEYVQALSAILDLQGFTEFCNQIDSHIVIPEFLDKFLNWLFAELRDASKYKEKGDSVLLWNTLPFYAKFLGDGVLFLWNSDQLKKDKGALYNTINRLLSITEAYRNEFYKIIQSQFSKPPQILRCGIARGQIISIGNGEDYVGSCINVSARLQKVSSLSFVVSRRGFDLTESKNLGKKLIIKKYKIRGIGEDEIIYILKSEFEKLDNEEKKLFSEV